MNTPKFGDKVQFERDGAKWSDGNFAHGRTTIHSEYLK